MNRMIDKILKNRLTIPFTPFYKTYPYKGGVSINSADSRGCVDMEMGFFFNRIPKAANSTVVINLARCKLGKEIPSRQAKKIFATPSSLKSREIEKFSALFRFTVVRNPYTRVLSAYLDKVERRAIRSNKASSFLAFLHGLQNGRLYDNAHWAPQSALLLLPLHQFDFIGRVETLDKDLEHITKRIQGKPAGESFPSVFGNATGASRKVRAYYDPETAGIVRSLYRDDFEIFCYSEEIQFDNGEPLPGGNTSACAFPSL